MPGLKVQNAEELRDSTRNICVVHGAFCQHHIITLDNPGATFIDTPQASSVDFYAKGFRVVPVHVETRMDFWILAHPYETKPAADVYEKH